MYVLAIKRNCENFIIHEMLWELNAKELKEWQKESEFEKNFSLIKIPAEEAKRWVLEGRNHSTSLYVSYGKVVKSN